MGRQQGNIGDSMTPNENLLCDKLRKIEAMCAGAGATGERDVAEAAVNRLRAPLTDLGRQNPALQMQSSMVRFLSRMIHRHPGQKPCAPRKV